MSMNATNAINGTNETNETNYEDIASFVNPNHFDTPDAALDAYVKYYLQERFKNRILVHKSTARKKIAATIIYALLLFLSISLRMFYHTYRDAFDTVIILSSIIWLISFCRFKTGKALRNKILTTPDADIDNVLAGECDSMVERKKIIATNVLIVAGTLLVLALVFRKPYMIFEKNDSGYTLRYYTYSLFPERHIVIPDTWKGEPVTEIRGDVFFRMNSISTIDLPKGLKEIRGNTFENCRKLESVHIPKKVKRIGGYAFSGCVSLERVEFPKGLKKIGGYAFSDCLSLRQAELPEGLTEIGGYAFDGCSSLEQINFPKSLTEISGYAFGRCSSLRQIDIPENIKRIGGHAFSGCNSLWKVVLREGLKEIGGYAFYQCYNLKQIEMPEHITTIGGYAFSGCRSLEQITLPKGLVEIRGNTFEGCSRLKRIDIPESVWRIGGHAFCDCSNLSRVRIPSRVNTIGSSAFRRCSRLRTILLPPDCSLDERTFKETSVEIGRMIYRADESVLPAAYDEEKVRKDMENIHIELNGTEIELRETTLQEILDITGHTVDPWDQGKEIGKGQSSCVLIDSGKEKEYLNVFVDNRTDESSQAESCSVSGIYLMDFAPQANVEHTMLSINGIKAGDVKDNIIEVLGEPLENKWDKMTYCFDNEDYSLVIQFLTQGTVGMTQGIYFAAVPKEE